MHDCVTDRVVGGKRAECADCLAADLEKTTKAWALAADERDKRGEELKAALLQVDELAKNNKGLQDGWADCIRKLADAVDERDAANRLYRELQERYDIYAKHLKTCAVYIGQEIPCDCGFICGAGMPFGQSGVPDYCTKPKPCPDHPRNTERPKGETRYCVKCGIAEPNAAHVYTCDGPGNAANPAPFIEKRNNEAPLVCPHGAIHERGWGTCRLCSEAGVPQAPQRGRDTCVERGANRAHWNSR